MSAVQKVTVTIRKVIHRIAQWPSKTVHLVYSLGPIKKRTHNDRISSVEAHICNLPALSADETALAHALTARGFCTSQASGFDSFAADTFRAASGEIYDLMERTYIETGKTINIIDLLGIRPPLMDRFETIFRAGLDTKLLKVIEHYLQLPVAYGGVDIFFTAADGLEKGARTWHKDSEDHPMVKVAVYLNDVGDADGPLEILHVHHAPPGFETSRGFRQRQLVAAQNEGRIAFDITSFTGPVGTVIFCDTSKYYHRGKPATGKNRRALFYNYYANKPRTPYFCPNPPFSPETMTHLVSDLSTTQKDAALWRETLTGLDKVVTKRKPYLDS